nr:dihydropteroate synthase [Bacteroidota bacterium]
MVLNCNGRLLDLNTPKVMGILNYTADSFYDGGRHFTMETAVMHCEKMLAEGAHIIDIGAASTRQGAPLISAMDEIKILQPLLKNIAAKMPSAIISIDTYNAQTASMAAGEGASLINDISGGTIDENMFDTIAKIQLPYILMHIQGVPATMHLNPNYNDVVTETMQFFVERISKLRALGVKDIIIDPGLGFGKKIEHNFQLLNHLKDFQILDLPVLIGISRKSMIWKSLNITPDEALNGTIALNMAALINGANILRVHDVKPAVECTKLYALLKSNPVKLT